MIILRGLVHILSSYSNVLTVPDRRSEVSGKAKHCRTLPKHSGTSLFAATVKLQTAIAD